MKLWEPGFIAGDVWTSFYDKVKEVKDWRLERQKRTRKKLWQHISGLPPTLLCQSGFARSAELRMACG